MLHRKNKLFFVYKNNGLRRKDEREKRQNNHGWALFGFCIKETSYKKTFLRGPDKFEYGLGNIRGFLLT